MILNGLLKKINEGNEQLGNEKICPVLKPIQFIYNILYSVGERNGHLNFRDDYGHIKDMLEEMLFH